MKDFYKKLYVPIRSVQPSRHSCELLYVPIYVPYTFRIRSPYKMKDFAGKLYVLIRSVQPSRYSRELQEIRTRSACDPIHSVQLLHKICEMGYGPTASEGIVQ